MKRLALAAVALLTVPALPAIAAAQSAPKAYQSAASNNSTLVKAGRVNVNALIITNSTATAYYLKLYDKLTAPTCGTDVPVTVVVAPPLAVGGLAQPALGDGLMFFKGLGFCLVAGVATADNTNAATGVVINFGAGGN